MLPFSRVYTNLENWEKLGNFKGQRKLGKVREFHVWSGNFHSFLSKYYTIQKVAILALIFIFTLFFFFFTFISKLFKLRAISHQSLLRVIMKKKIIWLLVLYLSHLHDILYIKFLLTDRYHSLQGDLLEYAHGKKQRGETHTHRLTLEI
jgi:hypothetical protein